MSESRQTKDGELILDSHKLSFHMDRIKAWENGDKIAPVTVDMALTRACGSMCKFCYATMQESQKRFGIKEHHALNLLDDFAEAGVRGVSLVSDGESTLSKAYVPFIQHAAEIGIDVGNATNAWEWGPEKSEQVLPHMSWIRFTVAAGTPEKYAEIMKIYKEFEEMDIKNDETIKSAWVLRFVFDKVKMMDKNIRMTDIYFAIISKFNIDKQDIACVFSDNNSSNLITVLLSMVSSSVVLSKSISKISLI